MKGYIKIHRQLQDNLLWQDKPFSKGQAWIDLLLCTNYKKNVMTVKNGLTIFLERGECGYSMVAFANRWGWSRSKVKRFFDFLNEQKMIQQKITANHSIFKILNYNNFQDDTTNSTTNSTTNVQQTVQQTSTIKKEKKEKKDKKFLYDPSINSFKIFFSEEYKKLFGTKPFLSFQDSTRIVELASEYDNFKEIIPEALMRLKNINFEDIDFRPSANWLLKGNNFERVMNGEFEKKKKENWRDEMIRKARENDRRRINDIAE